MQGKTEHNHRQDTLLHDDCPRCRLNAWSPELLEACKEALKEVECGIAGPYDRDTRPEHADLPRVKKLLESAIKKAEGE